MKIKKADDYSKNFDSRFAPRSAGEKFDLNDYFKTVNKNLELLKEINERSKANGTLVGRYFKTPVGDGFAYYQVIETTKTKARVQRCVGLGDDLRDLQFMDKALVNLGYVEMLVRETERAVKYTFPV